MSVEAITKILAAEMDEHGCEEDDEKRWQVAHHWAVAVVGTLREQGQVILPASVVSGTIKSFRDVEGHQLYDAATHCWIDLLAEQQEANS